MPSSTSCFATRMIPTSCASTRPPLFFGAAVFVLLIVTLSRGVLLPQDPPALPVQAVGTVRVLLGAGFAEPGVHQFSDGLTVRSVIELTGGGAAGDAAGPAGVGDLFLAEGMAFDVVDLSENKREIWQGWMPARQRLALGIALHPDRMSREDWEALPGIGPRLAEQIENDRQIYGDFGSFEALERVKGIGPGKLKGLRAYFSSEANGTK
ncbi:MAG: hypothetical protein FDZ69_06265 [Deltaproteobacteria bacterium]|nr:MAG: hypothetical protein FDZ69_06265 [Deltaproteobacteria bacterium]